MFPQYQFKLSSGEDTKMPSKRMWNNSRSKEVLGIRYNSQENVVRETVASMVETGWVPAKPVAAAKL